MDQESQLNVEIREIIQEIMPKIQPDFQLEVVRLSQQINRVNHLIYRQNKSWVNKLIHHQTKERELLLWLAEIKNILLAIQTGSIGREVVQEFRIHLTKYLNQSEYFLWGRGLNFVLNLYYYRSNTAKITLGLVITFLLAIGSLSILSYFHLRSEKLIYSPTPSTAINHLPNQKKKPEELNSKNPNFNQFFQLLFFYSGIAGVLGSVTSILLRAITFDNKTFDDPLIPFLIGLLKPIIGLMLGIFISAVIQSDIIVQLDVLFPQNAPSLALQQRNRQRRIFFVFSCAFIIGFSERLASDLLSKTESTLLSYSTVPSKKSDEI
jgi:hypothetical protein